MIKAERMAFDRQTDQRVPITRDKLDLDTAVQGEQILETKILLHKNDLHQNPQSTPFQMRANNEKIH